MCITFDYDALSMWVGMLASTNPTQVSRGEFAAVAIPRILTYLREQEIPASPLNSFPHIPENGKNFPSPAFLPTFRKS